MKGKFPSTPILPLLKSKKKKRKQTTFNNYDFDSFAALKILKMKRKMKHPMLNIKSIRQTAMARAKSPIQWKMTMTVCPN